MSCPLYLCLSRSIYVFPAPLMSFPRKRESTTFTVWIPDQVRNDKYSLLHKVAFNFPYHACFQYLTCLHSCSAFSPLSHDLHILNVMPAPPMSFPLYLCHARESGNPPPSPYGFLIRSGMTNIRYLTRLPSKADFKMDFLNFSALIRALSIVFSTLSITENRDSISETICF